LSDAYAQRLVDQRKQAEHRFNELLDTAVAENRDLTTEEETEKGRLIEAMRSLKAHADELVEAQKLSAQADEARSELAPFLVNPGERSTSQERTEDQILSELLRPYDTDNGANFMVSKRTHQTLAAGWEKRAALVTAGGSAVPTTFADFVAINQVTADPTYGLARKLPTRTGQPIVLPNVTAQPAVAVTAEGSAIGTSNPTIAPITLYAFKFPVLCDYTFELERDEVIGLAQVLGETVGIAAGTAMGQKFAIGTGTTEPTGFLVTGTAGATATLSMGTATTGYFDWGDLVRLKNSVPAPYRNRPSSAWQVSNTGLNTMQQLRDDNGAPVWYASSTPGVADRFMGNAIYENPAMAAVGSAVGSAVAFGDFNQYVIREVQPVRIERSAEWQFGSDIITLKTVFTVDGHLAVSTAIRRLLCANA
jgi:HK97 family phage major capsid protein